MLDIHSHILPGVDDGSKNIEESLGMLHAARKAGVTGIVATPHVRKAGIDGTLVRDRFFALQERARQLGIDLGLGFEVHYDALLSIPADRAYEYCQEGTCDILVEFSARVPVPYEAPKKLRQLQQEGLHVIIAHPERYPSVQKDIAAAQLWLDMGCELQLDANELLYRVYGASRRCARALLKRGMYQYIASDAHCAQDYARFAKALGWIAKNIEQNK